MGVSFDTENLITKPANMHYRQLKSWNKLYFLIPIVLQSHIKRTIKYLGVFARIGPAAEAAFPDRAVRPSRRTDKKRDRKGPAFINRRVEPRWKFHSRRNAGALFVLPGVRRLLAEQLKVVSCTVAPPN